MNVRRARGPHNRSVHTQNHADVLPLCTLALVLLLAPVAYPQVLEGVITLPDTLGPLNGPYCLACTDDSAFPRLYVGGTVGLYPGRPPEDSGGVIVAEARTCKRLARIPTGPVKALCFVPPHNKLYVAKLNTDSVEVVDCATNQIVTAVQVAGEVPVMQYNRQNDRLYCGGGTTSVIDCSADTLLHTIPVSASVFALDSIHHKLYVGRNGPLSVIDCAADTFLATLPEIDSGSALCFNPTAKKVYAVSGDTLFAVDAHSDTVVAQLGFSEPGTLLACDPQRNRIYCVHGGSWSSVDCASDSVILTAGVGQAASFLACNVTRDRLYLTLPLASPCLCVVDATTGQGLSNVWVDGYPSGAAWCSVLDRAYCLPQRDTEPHYHQSCLLTAVSGTDDCVIGIVPLTMRACEMCVDTVHNRLHFLYTGTIGCLGTVDCGRNVVTSYVYAGLYPRVVCYNGNKNSLYFGARAYGGAPYDTIVVFDCTAESVEKRIPLSEYFETALLHPVLDKLYVLTWSYKRKCGVDALGSDDQCAPGSRDGGVDNIDIIDCNLDSLVGRIQLPGDDPKVALLAPECDRLFYMGSEHVLTIDCLGDSILADTAASLGANACYSAEERKVFTSYGSGPLYTIDMDNPAIVESLSGISGATDVQFCYVPNAHKVYWCADYFDPCPGYSVFRVVDSRANVITAMFNVPRRVTGMCLDHTGDYVYCNAQEDSVVFVLDTRVDSVVANVRVPSWPAGAPLLNARTGRIYLPQLSISNLIPVIRDSMIIGLSEKSDSRTHPACIAPTMVGRAGRLRVVAFAELYDASGRRVATLRQGPNDISRLAPGIYFVREASGVERGASRVTKVVVLRQ